MALLEMKKVALIAHIQSKEDILKTLQNSGTVEITSSSIEDLKTSAEPQSLGSLEDKLSQVREALDVIRKYDASKTPFLAPKPAISKSELSGVAQRLSEADEAVLKVKRFSDEMNSLKARKQRIKARIDQLEPYSNFDAPLESVNDSTYTNCLIGSIPAENAEKYFDIVDEFNGSACFETICESKDGLYVWVIMHKEVHERLTGELKYIGFSEGYTKDLYGIPKDIIFDLRSECNSLEQETAEYEEKAKKFAEYKDLLSSTEDYLVNEIERERVKARLGETGTAFVLEGWLIAEDQERIEKALLKSAPELYIEFREPAEDENPPTAVKNTKVIEPFEAITDMYSIPSSRGYDPNKIMAFFYFTIYGMIIGDAAYGVILALGGFLVLKLKKPSGMFRRVTTIIMYCGISTIIWGLIYGTVFSIPGIPAVINQVDDAMMLLLICLGLGVIHIITGLIVGMYIEIRSGNFLGAIFDKFSWIMVILGGIAWLAGGSIAGLGDIGKWVCIAGALILLLTQGRSKKGLVKKITGGLGSLYGVTGYVSDILSYSRIFGMGLSTTVIAQVFNTIAGLVMGSAIGYVFGIIILIIGHSFNIVINALGAFVHTARLQFIEFYSKFYQGDGRAFAPLTVKSKNHRLVD